MRREPGEPDDKENDGNKNPAAGRIFATARSVTAATAYRIGDRPGKRENYGTDARRMGKKRSTIAPAPNNQGKDGNQRGDSENEVLNDLLAQENKQGAILRDAQTGKS